MKFKIKNTTVTISFSFLLLFLYFSLTNNLDVYINSLMASLLHEFVHIFFIILYKENVAKITFNIFGGKIEKANKKIISNNKEAIINLSAPLFNIIVGLISLLINRNSRWGVVNLFIGCFNILPFSFFDGGRGLYFLLSDKFSEKTSKKLITIISVMITVIFTAISVYIFLNHYKNYSLVLMSLYMIISVFLKPTS